MSLQRRANNNSTNQCIQSCKPKRASNVLTTLKAKLLSPVDAKLQASNLPSLHHEAKHINEAKLQSKLKASKAKHHGSTST